MPDQKKTNHSTESHLICDQCIYEQLSEDWRNRDRMIWQLPAVLAVVGGLLLVAIFREEAIDSSVKDWLLGVGVGFACLLTVMVAGNVYFQAVGEDLMDKIKEGAMQAAEARKGARRIPMRREAYRVLKMLEDIRKRVSSVLLLGLCIFIAGLFAYLLFDFSCCWFAGGSLISLTSAVGIVWYCYVCFKVKPPSTSTKLG